MPKWRYRPTIAGDETLLQFALPPRVGTFHTTRSVLASMQNAAPDPSTA